MGEGVTDGGAGGGLCAGSGEAVPGAPVSSTVTMVSSSAPRPACSPEALLSSRSLKGRQSARHSGQLQLFSVNQTSTQFAWNAWEHGKNLIGNPEGGSRQMGQEVGATSVFGGSALGEASIPDSEFPATDLRGSESSGKVSSGSNSSCSFVKVGNFLAFAAACALARVRSSSSKSSPERAFLDHQP